MLAVPPALLDILQLGLGAKVGIAVKSGHLIVEPQKRPRYTLNELLAQCSRKAAVRGDHQKLYPNPTFDQADSHTASAHHASAGSWHATGPLHFCRKKFPTSMASMPDE